MKTWRQYSRRRRRITRTRILLKNRFWPDGIFVLFFENNEDMTHMLALPVRRLHNVHLWCLAPSLVRSYRLILCILFLVWLMHNPTKKRTNVFHLPEHCRKRKSHYNTNDVSFIVCYEFGPHICYCATVFSICLRVYVTILFMPYESLSYCVNWIYNFRLLLNCKLFSLQCPYTLQCSLT